MRQKENSHLTNQQIADISGVPVGTVNRIMSGNCDDPKFQTISALATALNVSLDEFTEEKPTMESKKEEKAFYRDEMYLLFTKMIHRQTIEKNVLFIVLMSLVFFIVVLFSIDLLNPNVGWFRG